MGSVTAILKFKEVNECLPVLSLHRGSDKTRYESCSLNAVAKNVCSDRLNLLRGLNKILPFCTVCSGFQKILYGR